MLQEANLSTHEVEEPVRALVAVPPDDVALAAAVSGAAVADRQLRELVQVGAGRVTLASLAARRVARALDRQRVAEEAGFAPLAVEAVSVVDTAEALAGGAVTVPDGAGVDVVVAVALDAGPRGSVHAVGIAKVAVLAELAAGPSAALGALDADGAVGIAGVLVTGSSLGAGTGLTVVGRAHAGVSVESAGALLAVVSGSVVLALANACRETIDNFEPFT